MTRRIAGLQWTALAENPWPAPRASGAKGRGLRFERAVAKALPGVLHGQWFKFFDNNGKGFCSPDLLFVCGGRLIVGECKLSDWDEADVQLLSLYIPVLRTFWQDEILPVVVAKYLTPFTQKSRVVGTWDAALAHPAPILHSFNLKMLAPPTASFSPPTWNTSCITL